MLQHNPILFTLGYLLVALIIIAYVLMALEAWDRRKK